jgi:integrase
LVITDEAGAAVSPSRLTDTFKRLARQAGLSVIRLHDARHTAGTHMYRATRDLKKVQRWMGHATAAITADLYVHDTADTDSAAAGQMADYLAQ